MHCDYKDITEVMGRPNWYDVKGFPRYCKFHPKHISNIYADIVIYYLIGCQACRKKFNVAEDFSIYKIYQTQGFKKYIEDNNIGKREPLTPHAIPYFKSIPKDEWGFLHYGDPPRHGCVGDTMNCDDLQIIEFWVNHVTRDWQRVNELEFNLPDMQTY